jgi:hypothetical protein
MADKTSCTFQVPSALKPDPVTGEFIYRNFVFHSSQQGLTYTVAILCDGNSLGSFDLVKGGRDARVAGPATDRHAVGTLSLSYDSAGTAGLVVFDGTLYGCVAVGLMGVIIASFD